MEYFTYANSHRIAMLPAVADISSPTATELEAGVDISGSVVLGGLDVTRTTDAVDAGLWSDRFQGTRPGRVSIGSGMLTGRKPRQGPDPLWDTATVGTHRYLVVRRGVPSSVAWTGGDVVEVYDVRFGSRTVLASTPSGPVLFHVPLFVAAMVDDAVLPDTIGLFALDEEDGDPILEEDGDFLLVESAP